MKRSAAFDSFRAPPTLQRCPCKITPSTDKLPTSTIHCLKMKMGAVKLLRLVVMPLPKQELRMVSLDWRNWSFYDSVADTPFFCVGNWCRINFVAHSKYWAAVST